MRSVIVLALLVTACAAGPGDPTRSTPDPASAPAPTAPPSAGGDSITGALGGDAALEGGCAWLDDGSTRWQVAWPEGYRVAFDPLTLHGPDGVVARDGDTLTVTGAEQRDVMTTCQVGPVWAATTVTAGG